MESPSPQGDWIKEAALTAWREVRLFGHTTVEMLRRPRRFGEAFGRGELRVLNPVAFTATVLALTTALAYLDWTLWPPLPKETAADEPLSLVKDALDAAGMYVHLAMLGLFAYGFLRLFRRRGPLGGSMAMALYAGGIATLLCTVVFMVVGRGGRLYPRMPPGTTMTLKMGRDPALLQLALWVPMVVIFAAFVWMLIASFAGLFRIKGRWPVLAVLVAFVASGAFFGYVDPPGHYGPHTKWKLVISREENKVTAEGSFSVVSN
jgi:hypothetical protein